MDNKEEILRIINHLKGDLKNLSYIVTDPIFLKNYKSIINFLSKLTPKQVNEVLTELHKDEKEKNEKQERFSDDFIKNCPINQVEQLLNESNIPRKVLEKIAFIRFNMTKGEVSSFTNKKELIERMKIYINNERTHESISRQASGNEPNITS